MTEIQETKRKNPTKGFIIGCSILFFGFVILVLIVLGISAHSLFITIAPDEVAVVISSYEPNGYSEIPLTPGNHMLRPLEEVDIFKVSKEKYLSSSTGCGCDSNNSGSATFRAKDGSEIILDYQIIYSINPEQVVRLYQAWQHRYQKGYVIPQSKKITEEVSSQYTSSEIALTKRNEIEQAIFVRLKSDFSDSNLVLFDFKIADVHLKK